MEKELNIAAILKDKPKGTKLFDTLRGINVDLDSVGITLEHIYCTGDGCSHYYTNTGGFSDEYPNGMQILKPSKEMQDWSKFAWKKGDVLKVATGSDCSCIFDRFTNDDYTEFTGVFDKYLDRFDSFATSDWCKVTDEKEYESIIQRIETQYGGKLNLDTLKIEKPQFKDGDIVFVEDDRCIVIFKRKHIVSFDFYACLSDNEVINYDSFSITNKLRPATDSEKQQLFAALSKENKAWDTDKKTIVDLPKKCEFKAFDKVLVRDTNDEKWSPKFFSDYDEIGIDSYPYGVINSGDESVYYKQCIPYNDQTAHLLGTTDDWKGGEA